MGSDALAAIRAYRARLLVGLDYDGTIAPIVDRPEEAIPVDGAIDVLQRLSAVVHTIVLLTGRPAATVVELGGLFDIPDLVVVGHYGLQVWCHGVVETPPPVRGVALVHERLRALLPADVVVEHKLHSIAVHTRTSSDPPGRLVDLEQPLRQLAADHGLEVIGGRFVWELRPAGADKGSALAALIARCEPDALLVAGDDLGDLPAFAVARNAARPTVCVAVRSSGSPREVAAAADVVVDGPRALVELLATLL